MKKILILLSIIYSLAVYSQDADFSQYNHSRLNLNPAFTGCDSTLVIAINYRLQWPNLSPTFKDADKNISLSIDKYIHAIRGGLGLNYLYEKLGGLYFKSRIDFSYSPHFELLKHKLVLKPGIQIGYFKNSIDMSKVTFGDMIDERRGFVYNTNEPPGLSSKSGIDLSAGLLLYSKSFFGGIAVHHFNEPDEGFTTTSSLPLKITIHGGANLKFKKNPTGNFILSPTVLFMQQQDFQMWLPGITAKYRFISLGISYRNEDAFISTIAIQTKYFRVGYSYDYTVSKLTNNVTGGSHEFGISGFLKLKRKHCKIKTLRPI